MFYFPSLPNMIWLKQKNCRVSADSFILIILSLFYPIALSEQILDRLVLQSLLSRRAGSNKIFFINAIYSSSNLNLRFLPKKNGKILYEISSFE